MLKSLLAAALPLLSLVGALSADKPLWAQPANEQPAAAPPASNETVIAVTAHRTDVELVEKFAKILETKNRIVRVDGFDPVILNVTAIDPQRIRVSGLMQGVTSLVITDEAGEDMTIDVFVKGDARTLQAIIDRKFPDSSIEAFKVQDAVALRGWVSHPEHITQIVEIAEQFYPKVLNQMRVGGVQQVLLKVKVMEAQRSLLRELGLNFTYINRNGYLNSAPGSIVSLDNVALQIPPTVEHTAESLRNATASFGIVGDHNLFHGFLSALREESLLKILAEPEVVATNGRPSTLLSGGEFPILVPQSLGTVSVQWREFGVRLEAVPTVLGGGSLRLELQPEVSERDFTNAVTLSGTTVPGLTVRRVNTQVEMKFGQTLMLAGLISSRQTSTTHKIPFFGELPYIGAAFSRKRYDEAETEVVITVTPELVAPLDEGQVPAGGPAQFTDAPTDRELMAYGLIEVPKYGERCSQCPPGQSSQYVVPGLKESKPTSAPPAPATETPKGELILPGPAPASDQSARTRNASTAVAARRPTSSGVRQVGFDAPTSTSKTRSTSSQRATTSRASQAPAANGSQTRTSSTGRNATAAPPANQATSAKSKQGRPGLIEPSAK